MQKYKSFTNFSIIIVFNLSHCKIAAFLYIYVMVTFLVASHLKFLPVFGNDPPCNSPNSQISCFHSLFASLGVDMRPRLDPARQSCLELEYKEIKRVEDSSWGQKRGQHGQWYQLQ